MNLSLHALKPAAAFMGFGKKAACLLLSGCLFFLATLPSAAQPVLTKADLVPKAGDQYPFLKDESGQLPAPGNGGANQTWDFRSYTATQAFEEAYRDCSDTPYFRLCGENPSYGFILRINDSNMALSNYSGYEYRNYIDADELFRFPMTYGTNYVDSFEAYYVVQGAQVRVTQVKGTDSVMADGWGTLRTPTGTYRNTLRIRRVQHYYDEHPAVGLQANGSAETYLWYAAGSGQYLYQIVHTPTSTVRPPTRYAYPASAVWPHLPGHNAEEWQVFPNPARHAATAHITLDTAASVGITILDMTGRMLQQTMSQQLAAGKHELALDLHLLPPGMYWVRLDERGGSSARKLLIE